MSEQLARRIIGEHKQGIFDAFLDAWQMWLDQQRIDPEHTRFHSARTISSSLHDYICQAIRKRFTETGDVTVQSRKGKFILSFGNALAMRFKKLNRRGEPSNNHTVNDLMFTQELAFPGFPENLHVTAGYILDPTKTELLDVRILCQRGSAILWSFSLKGDDNTGQMELFGDPSPVLDPTPAVTPPQRRVKPKTS